METINKETYWNNFAEDFEARQEFVAGNEIIQLVKNELIKEDNFKKVLELGCGTGLYTETIIENSSHVIATDFSEEMINSARKLRGDLKDVEFMQSDAMNLAFSENSFDTVFMANLIHFISDPEQVTRESYRVLNDGGTIVITSFAIDEMSFLNKIRMAIRFIKTFGKISKETKRVKTTQHTIEMMLENNGFRISKNKLIGKKTKAIYVIGKKHKRTN